MIHGLKGVGMGKSLDGDPLTPPSLIIKKGMSYRNNMF